MANRELALFYGIFPPLWSWYKYHHYHMYQWQLLSIIVLWGYGFLTQICWPFPLHLLYTCLVPTIRTLLNPIIQAQWQIQSLSYLTFKRRKHWSDQFKSVYIFILNSCYKAWFSFINKQVFNKKNISHRYWRAHQKGSQTCPDVVKRHRAVRNCIHF